MKKNKEMRKESSAKMKEKRQMMDNDMKTILTPDQYKKWEAQKAERKDKMKDNKNKRSQKKRKRNERTEF